GGGPERRLDHFLHEADAHLFQLRTRKACQRAEREFEVLDRIQGAGLVLGVELRVLAREFVRIDGANADHELAPFIVGVDRQNGVVEIKQGGIHCPCASSWSSSRNSGRVTGRRVSREYRSRVSSMADRERMSRRKWVIK